MTRVSSRASALFATILLAATAFAQVNFTHQTYGTPNFPTDIFVADLNGDGKDDIVVTEEDSNVVNVFLNHGDGTFTDQGSAQYPAGQNPEFVVVADINNDGKPDIVAAGGLSCFSQQSPPHVDLLLGNGDGTFQPPLETQLPQDECISGLALTKVNSANWDVAVTAAQNTVRLLMNNGSGPFTIGNLVPGPAGLGNTTGTISSADYNRDGHWDFAVNIFSETGGSTIDLFLGDGTGHYTIQQLFTPLEATGSSDVFFSGPWTVDVNADGAADLLVPFNSKTAGTTFQGGVIVARNLGNGTFTRTALRVNSRFFPLAKASVGDLNGDGLRDIVLPIGQDPADGNLPTFAFFRGLSTTTWAGVQYVHGNVGDNMEFTAVGQFVAGKTGFAGTGNSNDLTVWNVGGATPPTCSAPSAAGVHVCSPAANATVTSPVAISAAANGGTKPITAIKAYIDGKQVASSTSAALKASVATAAGTHTLNVNAWNSAGTVFTFQSKFTVH